MYCNDCKYADIYYLDDELACQCELSLDPKEGRTIDGLFKATDDLHTCPLTLDREELIEVMHQANRTLNDKWVEEIMDHVETRSRLSKAVDMMKNIKQKMEERRNLRNGDTT